MIKESDRITASDIFMSIWPALLTLMLTLVISVFFTEFTFVSGIKAVWLIFLRLIRLSFFLILPILFLPRIFSVTGRFSRTGDWELAQLKEQREQIINPLRNWLLRPLQGIGLSMLAATKLLVLLGIYTGSGVDAATVIHPGDFTPWRFLSTTLIVVAISLLLSYLWGLDDLGVRLYNRKTREIRMVGRYLGVILPTLFGFYGMISVFQDHSRLLAMLYISQIAVALYPPFVIFSVFHAIYIRRKEKLLLERLKVASSVVLPDIRSSSA